MFTVRQALSRSRFNLQNGHSACGHNKSYQRSAHHYQSRCPGIYLHIQFFLSASSSIPSGHSHFTPDGLYRHRWLQPPLLCWQGFEPETTAQFRYHSTCPSSKELFRNNDTNNVTTPTDILINLRQVNNITSTEKRWICHYKTTWHSSINFLIFESSKHLF